MKHLRFALLFLVVASGIARAQDDEARRPPIEIPDFSNLDEYIYEPKSVLTVGIRQLSPARRPGQTCSATTTTARSSRTRGSRHGPTTPATR